MEPAARRYIYAVIGAGGLALAGSLSGWALDGGARHGFWTIYAALTVLGSVVKLRLPRSEGTYSLSCLFLLYGVAHFSLGETLIAGCAGAAAQSLMNVRKRASLSQVLFNIANTSISITVCFLIARWWLAPGMTRYPAALMSLVAGAWFITNTVLVSGVLSLLEKKSLGEVCGAWYAWSFPFYLVGAALVGFIPGPGQAFSAIVQGTVSGEAWLILVPAVYLVHFFLGLADWRASRDAVGSQPNGALPPAARIFLVAIVTGGASLLTMAASGWQSQSPARFIVYLALAIAGATFKIRLPYLRATLAPAFVLLLVAVAQLSLAGTVVMAASIGAVQVLWRPRRRPMLAQVLFNPACQVLSSAAAWAAGRGVLGSWQYSSLAGVLVICTLVLYCVNSVTVATMLALVDRKPLGAIWQLCCFWSLPYYMVGAAAAGLMTVTSRTAGWPPSLLVLPLLGLVYVSYRVQVSRAASQSQLAPA